MNPKHIAQVLMFIAAIAGVYFLYSAVFGSVGTPKGLEDGLVGHWTFDGPDMLTNVADSSGQGNDGSLVLGASGNTATTTSGGMIGQALEFDGVDDYVSASPSSSLEGASVFTVSFWASAPINPPSGTWRGAVSIRNGTASSNLFLFYPYDGSAGNGVRIFWNGSSPFDENGVSRGGTGFHHFSIVNRSATDHEVYVDGASIGTFSTDKSLVSPLSDINIGIWRPANQPYQGALDDVRIYNRALSATEITQLYNLGAAKLGKTPTGGSGLTSDLVGHWTFDGPDMLTNVADVSGQGNNGSLMGQTSTTTVGGIIGQALEIQGRNTSPNDSHVIIPNSVLNGQTDVTTAMWIKTGVASSMALVSAGANNEYLIFFPNNINLTLYAGAQTASFAISALTDNAWHHIVVVRDDSNNEAYLYIDGQADNENPRALSMSALSIPSDCIVLGQEQDGCLTFDPAQAYDGSIDDVRIYNRALSATEVTQLYNLGSAKLGKTPTGGSGLTSGLVGHWTFDGPDMLTNVADVSGQGNNGSLVLGASGNTATTTSGGMIGQALEFDGVDDYVVMPDSASLSFTNPALTISGWVNLRSLQINERALVRKNVQWAFDFFPNTNKIRFLVKTSGGTDGWTSGNDYSYTFNVGEWQHFVGVYNGSNIEVFVDGVSLGTKVVTGNIVDTANKVHINSDAEGYGGLFLDSSLDDVRIYNRALSADEVEQLYNMGR